MNKKFVIFKNLNLKYRKESFGGIVKLNLKIFILNKKQYQLLDKIKKVVDYTLLNKFERKIADGFLEKNILLKVDLNRAKELGFKTIL